MLNSKSQLIKTRLGFICFLPWVFFGTFFVAGSLAQVPGGGAKPKPVPPTGPLLNPAPKFSEWVITFSYPQDRPSLKTGAPSPELPPLAPSLPRKILTTKTGDVVHEQTQDVSGKVFEKWQDGPKNYIKPPGQTTWGVLWHRGANNNTSDPNFPLPENGFRGLDWINATAYAGTIKTEAGAALVFLGLGADYVDLSDPKSAKDKLANESTVAYIDFQTRLPSSVKEDDVIRTYTFTTPPSAMQKLPADLTNEIKKGNESRAKLLAAPKQEF